MCRVFVALLCVAVGALAAPRTLPAKFGPKGPIPPFTTADCAEDLVYIADAQNLCWFHQCVETVTGEYALLPRRCALGSKMPSAYMHGSSNPCSVNFNTQFEFECTRTEDMLAIPQEPDCAKTAVCYNEGELKYDNNICWCDCPEEWRGNFDCSKPTAEVEEITESDGIDECETDILPCDAVGGCENDGVCHNLCKDFWCECPPPFTNGKRCESFSCDPNPCKNGGTCNRGDDNLDEVTVCSCPDGYSGLLCEMEETKEQGEADKKTEDVPPKEESEEKEKPVEETKVEETTPVEETPEETKEEAEEVEKVEEVTEEGEAQSVDGEEDELPVNTDGDNEEAAETPKEEEEESAKPDEVEAEELPEEAVTEGGSPPAEEVETQEGEVVKAEGDETPAEQRVDEDEPAVEETKVEEQAEEPKEEAAPVEEVKAEETPVTEDDEEEGEEVTGMDMGDEKAVAMPIEVVEKPVEETKVEIEEEETKAEEEEE